MKLPLRLEVGILTVFDADEQAICRADEPPSDGERARVARDLRRLVVAANFTRFFTTDGMEQIGVLPITRVVSLEQQIRDDPQTHFGSGPKGKGIVR